MTRLADGRFRAAYFNCTIKGFDREKAYIIKRFDDGLKIVDYLFE